MLEAIKEATLRITARRQTKEGINLSSKKETLIPFL
jgi:hypothetical protein